MFASAHPQDNAATALSGDVQMPALPGIPVRSVTCRVFRAPVTDGVAMSFAPMAHRAMAIVVVELDDGRRGLGESWVNYPGWAWRERIVTVQEGIAPLVCGEVFDTPASAHELMVRRLAPLGRQWGAPGPIHQAISAVDTALWDLAGQHAGVPISGLLGGALADEIRVYASSLGPQDVETTAQGCVAAGHLAVKVKLGFGQERDTENLRAARAALGDDVHMFADANQAWTLEEALAMVPTLREAGVQWLEEPLQGDRPDQLASLRKQGGLPLATGENLYGAESFRPYLDQGAVDILQPDLSKVGGPTEYLRICALAAGTGATVNPHLYGGSVATAATLQVASAMQATRLIEWDVRSNPLRAAVNHLLTDHGTVRIPQGPGLGLDIDLEALAHAEETP